MAITHLEITTIALLVFVTAVALVDLRRHRIPNALTVPAAAASLIGAFVVGGGSGALASAAGLLTGLLAFLPFYLARGFGAGDVKAMAAVGAFLGPKGALLAAAWTLVAGAVGALALLAARGGAPAIRGLTGRWAMTAATLAAGQRATLCAPPGDPARHRFPYGIAIACGTVASLLWT